MCVCIENMEPQTRDMCPKQSPENVQGGVRFKQLTKEGLLVGRKDRREGKRKEKPCYDRHCRELEHASRENEPHVVRLKTALTGVVEFDDLVRGRLSFDNQELDDLVIKRTDGSPTYNLSVVVDDADSRISCVIRGDDHINNTPRQINIYKALGWTIPRFAQRYWAKTEVMVQWVSWSMRSRVIFQRRCSIIAVGAVLKQQTETYSGPGAAASGYVHAGSGRYGGFRSRRDRSAGGSTCLMCW